MSDLCPNPKVPPHIPRHEWWKYETPNSTESSSFSTSPNTSQVQAQPDMTRGGGIGLILLFLLSAVRKLFLALSLWDSYESPYREVACFYYYLVALPLSFVLEVFLGGLKFFWSLPDLFLDPRAASFKFVLSLLCVSFFIFVLVVGFIWLSKKTALLMCNYRYFRLVAYITLCGVFVPIVAFSLWLLGKWVIGSG